MDFNRVSALAYSAVFFSLAYYLTSEVFANGSVEPLPLHSMLESGGVMIAIVATLWLLLREKDSALSAVPVAIGFLGMAILDGFHASVSPGDTFIFLRSAANLFGSIGFLLAWIPEKVRRPVLFWTRLLPIGVAILCFVFGGQILRYPDVVPVMINAGKFSPIARTLNYISGALFLLSVPRFAINFYRTKQLEPLLFACLGLIFGLASVIFSHSVLWNNVWWTWHGLRLTAYAAVLCLINFEYRGLLAGLRLSLVERSRVELELRNLNAQLEQRVAERTRELNVEFHQRKYAQESLSRSQENLVRAQAIARIGNWERDLSTNSFVLSDEMYRIIGMEPGDPKGTYENFLAAVHPEDRESVKKRTEEAIRDGKPYALEFRLHREKDGDDVIIRSKATMVYDKQGKPLRFVGTAQDITELKRAKERLRFTQFTVDHSADFIFWIDRTGHFLYANAAACQHLGYTQEELLHLTVADINPLYPREAWKPHWDKLKEEKVFRFETLHQGRTGKPYPVEVTANFMAYGNREIICSFARDISERKRVEEALAESQAKLRAIIEAEPECVKLLDAQGGLLEMNQAGLRIIEADDLDQVRGQCVYPIVVERNRSAFVALTNRVFEGQSGTMDYEIIGLKGGRRWLSTSAVPLYDQHNRSEISALLAITRDITERKMHEKELQEAKEEAEKANHTKDLFLATLSHELRTPLTAILSWAQMLKMGRLDPSKTEIGLQAIEDSARSQNQLISDLLDISRISAGKIALDIQETELTDIVRQAIETVRIVAEKQSLDLITQLGPMPIFVLGDAGRLKQIVWNLLSNAIKFTPPGGRIEVLLGICEEPSGHKAQICIRDTGKGISADFLPHIFEPFSQADSSSVRTHGGLGLGLALVHNLLELQSGSIEAQSEGEGKGATFTVSLPLGSAGRFLKPEPAMLPANRSDLSGISVLFVDDEASMLQSIKELLSSFGAKVSVASSVPEALVEFERSRPDVIVSDIAMPNEDGYSLIRKIRNLGHQKGGDTPAVALTAFANSQSRELALTAGYHMHLAKPVDSDELVRTILSAKKAIL
ncbi:MAG: PAS domain S-box protein [Bdellovibrio sp.]|nr:PAS domain S-box protein [Bdellovibrio sp.]